MLLERAGSTIGLSRGRGSISRRSRLGFRRRIGLRGKHGVGRGGGCLAVALDVARLHFGVLETLGELPDGLPDDQGVDAAIVGVGLDGCVLGAVFQGRGIVGFVGDAAGDVWDIENQRRSTGWGGSRAGSGGCGHGNAGGSGHFGRVRGLNWTEK